MRFLVDECTGATVSVWLRNQGHDVVDATEANQGANDIDWIQRAASENRVLITDDKDFGEKVYRDGHTHVGVVLLRLKDSHPTSKVAAIERLLASHGERIIGRFVVVTERKVRFGQKR